MLWFAQPQIVVHRRSKPASEPGACSGCRKSSQTSVRAQYQGPAHSSGVGGASRCAAADAASAGWNMPPARIVLSTLPARSALPPFSAAFL